MFDRDWLKAHAAALAARGVYVGASSWKYPGWRGTLYDEARYVWRGKYSHARFEKLCLGEYAEVFKTVCVDAAYYKFPESRYLEDLAALVPEDFQFAFKVTDEITLKHFPNFPRFGARAGQTNLGFLNVERFVNAFLKPCETIRRHVGLLMFEFSRFYPNDFARGRDFLDALEPFLARLPAGWRYGVEIRNRHFLRPEYFALLARYGVTHVFNSWQDMPAIGEQMSLEGSHTTPDCLAARFLLQPGRSYEEAVKRFSPYERVVVFDDAGRWAGAQLIRQGLARPEMRTFVYVNNRFEGSALGTIRAMLENAEGPSDDA